MKVDTYRYLDEWIPNYYPARKVSEDKYIRISRVGTITFLTRSENVQLHEVFMDKELYDRLEASGHIITAKNSDQVMNNLQTWYQRTFGGTELHIVVLTRRCNLNCTYCHMNPVAPSAELESSDMQPHIQDAVIDFAFSSPSKSIIFEFQGGEAFLNFPGMMSFVEKVKNKNINIRKNIEFAVTTNLTVITDKQMQFCSDNGIRVSFSLNGSEAIHNRSRITRQGYGSFDAVMKKIKYLRNEFPGVLSSSPLCVVSKDTAPYLKATIDFFHEHGFKQIAIIPLNPLGHARKNNLSFDIHDFLRHYIDALNYIYEKNKTTNGYFSERIVSVLLMKILCKVDTSFVDWRNPCGNFGGAVVYDYDGELLPADEARSLRHEFSLGNVMERTYFDLIQDRNTFRTMNLSFRDRDSECRECPFNPYCGVSPILNYARTGDATPKPNESEECLKTIAVLDWIFKKLVEDPLPLLQMLPELNKFKEFSKQLHLMEVTTA
ncbi:MAG: radical SAM protein [Xenococcaceae cyanobacterium MO_188.B29]|nr:radical SAM protein [Xenococcaceae cyanobacterium MO_188.B29]